MFRPYLERRNILKIWKFSMLDLYSLGVRTLWNGFCVNTSAQLINIGLLQHAMLRAALLLGVTIHPRCKFVELSRDGTVRCDRISFDDIDVLVDSSGNRAVVREQDWDGAPLIGSTRNNKASKESIAVTF